MSATATPSAATTTKVLLTSAPRTSSLPPLFPPFRFSAVQEDLFRGSYPKPRNHRFLRRLRLRTILSLTPDPATPELRSLAEASGITLVHIRVDKPKEDSIPLSFSRCSAILQVLTDASRLPLYVHCLDGCLVTGLVILALRKLQLWTISSAITEYTRFLGGEELVAGKEVWEFIERFSGEVELVGASHHNHAPSHQSASPPSGMVASASFATSTSAVPGSGSNILPRHHMFTPRMPSNPSHGGQSSSPSQYANIPKWLWGGVVPFKKHPTIRIKFPQPPQPPPTPQHSLSTSSTASSHYSSQSGSSSQPSRLNTHEEGHPPLPLPAHSGRRKLRSTSSRSPSPPPGSQQSVPGSGRPSLQVYAQAGGPTPSSGVHSSPTTPRRVPSTAASELGSPLIPPSEVGGYSGASLAMTMPPPARQGSPAVLEEVGGGGGVASGAGAGTSGIANMTATTAVGRQALSRLIVGEGSAATGAELPIVMSPPAMMSYLRGRDSAGGPTASRQEREEQLRLRLEGADDEDEGEMSLMVQALLLE